MKNLRDYFSSPKTPDEQSPKTSPSFEKTYSEDTTSTRKTRKKPKKKDSAHLVVEVVVENDDDELLPRKRNSKKRKAVDNSLNTSVEKKRKQSSKIKKKDKLNDIQIPEEAKAEDSVKLDESDSIVENTVFGDEVDYLEESRIAENSESQSKNEKGRPSEETSPTEENSESQSQNKKGRPSEETSPTEGKKSLLNYFNKVEKTFAVKEDIKKITVKCLIHTPPKEKQAKRESVHPASEGTPMASKTSKSTNSRWKMRVNLLGLSPSSPSSCTSLSDDEIVVLDEVAEPTKKTTAKPSISSKQGIKELKKSTASNSPLAKISQPSKEVESFNIDSDGSSKSSLKAEECSKQVSNEPITIDSSSTDDDSNIGRRRMSLRCRKSPKPDIPVIDDDDSNSPAENPSNTRPKLKAGNLASYFGLKLPTSGKSVTKLTPEEADRRNQFLQSPAPEFIRKLIAKPVDESCGIEAPFPKLSHIRQEDRFSIIWNLDKMAVSLPPLSPIDCKPLPTPANYSSLCAIPCPTLEPPPPPSIPNQEGLPLKAWKKGLASLKKTNKDSGLWTDRYCPSTCSETILNGSTVDKLSEWLAAASHREAGSDESDSSGDDFEDGLNSPLKRVGNTCLIIGPPGCGKTAAVYAAAKHNQYQVLELNASCNRNGKKIISEFSEATQSHKVETKQLLKVKKSKKKKQLVECNKKKSLILIEDADIVLDGVDDGYINGLATLQAGSKRPLVLVVNSVSSAKHIQRLPVSLTLNLSRPTPSLLSKYLLTMAAVEKIKDIDEQFVECLIDNTKCDLRRSVVALQLGCYPPKSESSIFNRLSGLGNEEMTSSNALDKLRMSKALTTLDTMISYSQGWDSVYCYFDDQECEQFCYKDSNELLGEVTSVLLAHCGNRTIYFPQEEDVERRWRVGYEELVGDKTAVTHSVSRRTLSVDYMAAIRELARAESLKLESHTRRSHRLLSHLSQAGLSSEPEDLAKLISLSTMNGNKNLDEVSLTNCSGKT